MPIRFLCRDCQVRIKVSRSSVGRRVTCPRCGFVQPVPQHGHSESPSSSSMADGQMIEASSSTISDTMQEPEGLDHTETGHREEAESEAPALRALPQPIPRPVSTSSANTSRGEPLFSQAMPVPHSARIETMESQSESGKRGSQRRGDGPTYRSLLVLTWVFRALVFCVLGLMSRTVMEALETKAEIFSILHDVVLGVASVAALCLAAELSRAVRDVARNSFRQ